MKRAAFIVIVSCVYFATRAWLWQHAYGSNLTIYAYFADAVSVSRNPYTMPDGAVAARYADYPPILMALFGALAQVVSGRTAVKLVCFAGDLVLCVLAARFALRRCGLDRWATLALVFVNPLYLSLELFVVQYKTWIAAGLLALTLEWSAVTAGVMAGAFVLPALLIPTQALRTRAVKPALIAVAIAAELWLPYFPESLDAVFGRRATRSSLYPTHDSLFQVTGRTLELGVIAACFVGAAVLLVSKRGNVALRGSAALSLLACASPELQLNRMVAFTLPVLIGAPASARERVAAFAVCCLAYYGYEYRWHYGTYAAAVAVTYLPTVLAVWWAIRSP